MGKSRGQRLLLRRLVYSPIESKPRLLRALVQGELWAIRRASIYLQERIEFLLRKLTALSLFLGNPLKEKFNFPIIVRFAALSLIFTLPLLNIPVKVAPENLASVVSSEPIVVESVGKPSITSTDNSKVIPKVEQQVEAADAAASWWLPTEKLDSPFPKPVLSARSAIAIDVTSKKILFEKNQGWRVPQASTTKITTALVALERMNPNETITVSNQALNIPPGSSVMGVIPGERHPLRDLLYGLMLPSGNDAAMAIAAAVGGGDVSRFVGWMNDKATELGLNDTHYTDPHGVGGPDHYTTAYDLAVMTKAALDNPAFREIVNKGEVGIPSNPDHKSYYLVNLINSLFNSYPGFLGVKPGYTGAAGYCLVGAASRGGHTVITVVLGSGNHFAETQQLLDYSFQALGVS